MKLCYILLFSFHFFKLWKHRAQHDDEAQGAADDIGDGFREENAVGSHMEGIREQVCQRYDNEHFAKQGEKDRLLLFI